MDLEVFDMGEIIPDLVDDIIGALAFNRRNRRNRLEVGESDFEEFTQMATFVFLLFDSRR